MIATFLSSADVVSFFVDLADVVRSLMVALVQWDA